MRASPPLDAPMPSLPTTTIPIPAISTDAEGMLQLLSTGQIRAIDAGAQPPSALDGERWTRWGAARTGARTVLTARQRRELLLALLLLAVLLVLALHATLIALIALVSALYTLTCVYKVWLLVRGERAAAAGKGAMPDIAAVPPAALPFYSVLVPLRHERAMLPTLIERLRRLDYPVEKLEVLLLIEADDDETRAALAVCDLPPHMRPITVAPGAPLTKPRALNAGLSRVRGELVVVYDAEDQPDPDQLRKAAAAFRAAPERVICYQARLTFYNPRQSLLTRLFMLDYYVWYDLMLQGLARSGAFMPLGGTSNHLRVAALRRLGGWDPYNVTEDGDLGVRIARAGLEAHMLDSVTSEEAVAHVRPWLRQRSRWVKGYMQTYLTHMRAPRTLWRDLGPGGFLDFQALIGGSSLALLINPLMWALTLAYIFGHGAPLDKAIESLFPAAVYYPALLCLILGNFVFFYTNVYACVRSGQYDLARAMLLGPLYWLLMSLAAWLALLSLARQPYYWAKTPHGSSLRGTPTRASAALAGAPADGAPAQERAPQYALSIIVPAFNEAQRLPASLEQLRAYLLAGAEATTEATTEVIVVDDGSSDDTCALVRAQMEAWPTLRLLDQPHHGKGAAIRAGIFAARGAYVLLADADLSMSADQIGRFARTDLGEYDLALGVRSGKRAQRLGEPLHRRLMGRVFNGFVRLALLPGMRDTQCGFKCLRLAVARDLAQSQTLDGLAFDVELLYIARKRGYDIREVPIVWRYASGGHMRPLRSAFSMIGEVLSVRRNDRRGRYGAAPTVPDASGQATPAERAMRESLEPLTSIN